MMHNNRTFPFTPSKMSLRQQHLHGDVEAIYQACTYFKSSVIEYRFRLNYLFQIFGLLVSFSFQVVLTKFMRHVSRVLFRFFTDKIVLLQAM